MISSLKNITKLLICAIIIGLIVALFQFVASMANHLSEKLIEGNNSFYITIVFVFILGFIVLYVNNKIKGYTGSGVPQYEAYHDYELDFNPYLMLVMVFINSIIAFFCGFLLGGEGPSITIASSIGYIGNKISASDDRNFVAMCGSAGFACAFLSPLAGIMHLYEENKRVFSIDFLIKGSFIVIIASLVTFFTYKHRLLPYVEGSQLELIYYPLMLFVGVICFFVGRLYVKVIVKTKDLLGKNKIWNLTLPFFMVVFLALRKYYPYFATSGSSIIENSLLNLGLLYCLGLLIYRIIATAISANQKISGGLVLPMLAVGYVVGSIVVGFLSIIDKNASKYENVIVMCSMLCVFASVCNTPLTAIALAMGIMPINVIILPILLCTGVAYLFSRLFHSQSIYFELKQRIVSK